MLDSFQGSRADVQGRPGEIAGQKLNLWDSYGLGQYELSAGSFSEDSRGLLYLNVAVNVQAVASAGTASVGIDLGLKEAAVTSDGKRIEGPFYLKMEAKLRIVQPACNKARVKAIHAKIANQLKDMLHKFSTALVRANAAIFVGSVASANLVKTKMAKSTLYAVWSSQSYVGAQEPSGRYRFHRTQRVLHNPDVLPLPPHPGQQF